MRCSPGRPKRLLELAEGPTDEDWVVRVRPELVVEVAFDGVQQSPRYPAGMALRFARVLRHRPDKPAAEADTIDSVRADPRPHSDDRSGPPSVEQTLHAVGQAPLHRCGRTTSAAARPPPTARPAPPPGSGPRPRHRGRRPSPPAGRRLDQPGPVRRRIPARDHPDVRRFRQHGRPAPGTLAVGQGAASDPAEHRPNAAATSTTNPAGSDQRGDTVAASTRPPTAPSVAARTWCSCKRDTGDADLGGPIGQRLDDGCRGSADP